MLCGLLWHKHTGVYTIPYGGKLLREKTFTDWGKIRFLRIARFCSAKGVTPPNFSEKTFTNSHKTTKFTKVFSLESFPLYSRRRFFSTSCTNTASFPLVYTNGLLSCDCYHFEFVIRTHCFRSLCKLLCLLLADGVGLLCLLSANCITVTSLLCLWSFSCITATRLCD